MKIEIDIKELAALIDYIKGQRELIGDTKKFAEAISKELPQKIASQLNYGLKNSDPTNFKDMIHP